MRLKRRPNLKTNYFERPTRHIRTSDISMEEVGSNELLISVQSQHGGTATLRQAVHVQERRGDIIVWDGIVHVFDLAGHPNATRAYAWSSPIEGSTKRRFYAVLHIGGINSAQDAVRAAIVAEHKSSR